MKKRILWTTLALAWGLFIFSQSLKDGDSSGALSGSVVAFLTQFLPFDADVLHTLIRKGAHFAEYCVFGLLLANTFRSYGLFPRKFDGSVLFVGCFWAVLDEFLQTLIPGRAGTVGDVLIDSAGVLCGTLAVLIFVLYKRKKENDRCNA